MPSTATARLRLEKQGTGENANTWGANLNAKAFDLIDAAIAGRSAFSLSGTKTLTSNNYAADESRAMFLDVTGGTGGTITIPAVEKVYLVRNASSGSVILTTGSGTTGTIGPGLMAMVACDGTNVRVDGSAASASTAATNAAASAADAEGFADDAAASAAAAAASAEDALENAQSSLPTQTGNAGKLLTTNGTAASWATLAGVGAAIDEAELTSIVAIFDGGGSALTSSKKLDIPVDFACTIQSWTLVADQSGSIVIDVWKDTYANYPPTVADTIAGTEKPTLSSAVKNQDTTLSTWTTSISAGDILRLNIDSVSTVQRVTLTIKVRKV